MRIAIFGGAFDPPHNEHINICLSALEELKLDRVILVPSGLQPHKSSAVSSNIRYDMVVAAIRPYNKLIADDIELKYLRTGYAADILPLLQIKYGDFVYILGGDSFINMDNWYRPDLILSSYPLAIVARGNNRAEVKKKIQYYKDLYKSDITLLDYQANDISSSEVRAQLELNMNVCGMISDSVIEIINKNNLYSNYKEMVEKLRDIVSPKTYKHTRKTIIKALELNQGLGLPYEKVFIASLLHDVAKEMPLMDKYKYAIPEDAIDTPVMHAFQGLAVAEQEFNINDNEILNAIKYHTTGRARMTKLEMLIFVADMVEESRDYEGVNRLRDLIRENAILGFLACVEEQYNHLLNKDVTMYPLTQECYNYYIRRSCNDN